VQPCFYHLHQAGPMPSHSHIPRLHYRTLTQRCLYNGTALAVSFSPASAFSDAIGCLCCHPPEPRPWHRFLDARNAKTSADDGSTALCAHSMAIAHGKSRCCTCHDLTHWCIRRAQTNWEKQTGFRLQLYLSPTFKSFSCSGLKASHAILEPMYPVGLACIQHSQGS
jgi:hypothetical protein